LSPIIFNITLESVVRAIIATKGGYRLEDREYTNVVYTDDSDLVCQSGQDGENDYKRAALLVGGTKSCQRNSAYRSPMNIKGLPRAFV
jgi:hypothetical protein